MLFPLAAGLEPGEGVEVTHEVVASAIEHRLFGLLWKWVEAGSVRCERAPRDSLAVAMLQSRRQSKRCLSAVNEITELLKSHALDVAVLKGIGTEVRWYSELGTRPSVDLDLWLSPEDLERASEVVRLLDPGHPLESSVDELVRNRRVRSIDLRWNGFAVDLHFDPFKYGIWYTDLESAWSWNERLEEGFVVPGRPVELVISLLQLNKDRFSRLLNFADVARMTSDASTCTNSWELARSMGASVPVISSARVVASTLGVGPPVPTPEGHWRSFLWNRIWNEDTRLRGDDGYTAMRRRQDWIPLLCDGHLGGAIRHLLHVWFPPKPLLEYFNPHVRGQLYPIALVNARLPWTSKALRADQAEREQGYVDNDESQRRLG